MSSRKLDICIATMHPPGEPTGEVGTFMERLTNLDIGLDIRHNTSESNLGVVGSYQKLYERTSSPLLAFIHDDVICHEQGWDERVLAAFDDPEVGVVGFGGALGHGDPDMYKIPYELNQLRRFDYLSNVDDAEVHGARFPGDCDVSVLDGFALVTRRAVLDRAGGWRGLASGVDFFCYDYALCAMARRLGFRIRLVGVRCHHLGGRTSVQQQPIQITSKEAFDQSHRWFYETYRDVMPARVNNNE